MSDSGSSTPRGLSAGERPGTARVRIRDDDRTNPAPRPITPTHVGPQLQAYVSQQSLQELTGRSDLESVTHIDLQVDTRENSLGRFGSLLPNLAHLKLSNSIIPSIRDLGSTLGNLRVLWVARCGLTSLDGIGALPLLKELYCAYNAISDCRPLTMLDKLEVLDLEGNTISEFAQVSFMCLCSSLRSLTMEGNPVCTLTDEQGRGFREATLTLIPKLEVLDGATRGTTSRLATPVHHASSEITLVSEILRTRIDSDPIIDGRPRTGMGRPGTSSQARPGTSASTPRPATVRPPTAHASAPRPGSAMRPGSAARPGTMRPATTRALRPGSAATRDRSSPFDDTMLADDDDGSSALTFGSEVMFVGNPLKALKARKDRASSRDEEAEMHELQALMSSVGITMESQAGTKDTGASTGVADDLKAFRESFAKVSVELETRPKTAIAPLSSDDDESDGEVNVEVISHSPSYEAIDDDALSTTDSLGRSWGKYSPASEADAVRTASPTLKPALKQANASAAPTSPASILKKTLPTPPTPRAPDADDSKRRVLPTPPQRTLPQPPTGQARPMSSASARLRAARTFAQQDPPAQSNAEPLS